jgi:NitT/TauT family transport system permease protein
VRQAEAHGESRGATVEAAREVIQDVVNFRAEPSRLLLIAVRIAVIACFLAAWQWIPEIPGISKSISFIDPFFISSPRLVASEAWDLCTGADGTATIWGALWFTVSSAVIGTAIAVAIGSAVGVLLSNSRTLDGIFRPMISALNAIPRIALVPIVVLITGVGRASDVVTSTAVVIFLVFFNALEGGRSVPSEMVDNARILGANSLQIALRVRQPFVLAWVFAAMPNCLAFGLIGSVASELFTGAPGIGRYLQLAVSNANATLTFAVVFIITVFCVIAISGVDSLRSHILPWWGR